MKVISIDPGLDGAIAIFDLEAGTLETYDMPTFELSRNGKNKREIDRNSLRLILDRKGVIGTVIERVGSMPKQGVSSVFQFGKVYGIALGMLSAYEYPVENPAPQTWKKKMGLSSDKDASRARASDLMPACAELWKLKKHEGRAEAALMGLWYINQLPGSMLPAQFRPLVKSHQEAA